VLHEVVCPGCGETAWFSIETTPPVNVTVEFLCDRNRDGTVTIWAMPYADQRVSSYWTETCWLGSGEGPESDESIEIGGRSRVHDCADGGSGDREPREVLPSEGHSSE